MPVVADVMPESTPVLMVFAFQQFLWNTNHNQLQRPQSAAHSCGVLHEDELMENLDLVKQGQKPKQIAPL